MNSDCVFKIGSTHRICQDYAIIGERNNKNCVIVSDGCSSSPLTDIGARIIATTVRDRLLSIDNMENFYANECIISARQIVDLLKLPTTCLDATLMSIFLNNNDNSTNVDTINCHGDGVIIIKFKSNDLYIVSTEYEDGYPFYINYFYDKNGRYDTWYEEHNKRKITLSTIIENNENICIKDDIEFGYTIDENIEIRKELKRTRINIFDINLIEFIAIVSDGIHSFYESVKTETSLVNNPISFYKIIPELFSFKGYKGSFIQRRLNRFLKNCKKKNWDHYDDLSIGIIYTGE